MDKTGVVEALPVGNAALTVSGSVVDEDNAPLPGVNILVKGSTIGTTSDANGKYTITVAEGTETLVFSFIGYASQEIAINNQTQINVTMSVDMTSLSEVVVIGYGTQSKQDLTSSVASVKSENFVKGNVMDAGQLLQGKVAGLSVSVPSGDPTGGTQILLRGQSTILGTNQNPLILIDGVPGDLKTVAPEDIESIDVLKDGSAAAIYGTRGTNGVILITTKRASGDYQNRVEYSASVSTQSIARQLEMLSASDYRNQIADGSRAATDDLGASTNWLDEIKQTPFSHIHNITFRGGNARTNYLATINYRGLEGIFLKSDNKTLTGRVDMNHSMFNEKVLLNFGFLSQSNRFNTSGDGASFNGYTYRQALIRNPTAPVRDDNGNWQEYDGFNYENPVARLEESDGRNKSQNTRLNATVTWKPIIGLKLSSLFSINRFNQTRGYAETKKHISTIRDGRNGYASNGTRETEDKLMELTAQYSKTINDHSFTVLGGYSYQYNFYRDFWMQNWDFPTDVFSYHNIELGNALQEGEARMDGVTTETNLISFFGRATYNFKDRYLLMTSLRHEAASQLYGTEKPWGTFPAVSVGWRIANEAFMEDVTFLDDLKLRVGYGVTGTPNSNGFGAVALLGYGEYFYYNGQWIRTLVPSQNENPHLKWEEKHETNFGLDFSIFNSRISGSIDYYVRTIKDLLYDYAVPSPPNLYTTTRANVGEMENKGLEIFLTVVPVRKDDFEWTSSFNFSTNSNKLVSLSNDLYKTTNDYFTAGETGEPIQTHTHLVRVGERIGDFHGFKVVDVGEDGKWIYEDADGNHVSTAEFSKSFENKHVLGNGLPKYYAGWNNNIRYKNFDLAVTMRGAFGYQILNYERMYLENPTISEYNRLKSSQKRVFGKTKLTSELEFNSYYIEDGDFWKIDNITVGYNLPKINSKYIQSARFFVSTLNTVTITKYKGIDPEVNRLGLSPGNDGRDKYPTTRTYTLGFTVNF
jgi:TonB-linked SusC/RagA family outer membrane protein